MTADTHPADSKPITRSAPGDGVTSRRDTIAPVVAIATLVFFALVLLYLGWQIGLPQQQWDRLVFLLKGVEAIAFTAAGYLFGKEVNRQRAEKAEERAEAAEEDATNGQALATVVKTKAARVSRSGGLESSRSQGAADIQELGAIAEELFPDS